MKKDQLRLITEISFAAIIAIFILIIGCKFVISREQEEKEKSLKRRIEVNAISALNDQASFVTTCQY